MTSKCISLAVFILSVGITWVYGGFTMEERDCIYKIVGPLVNQCADTNGVTQEEILAAQRDDNDEHQLKPIFLACVLKITGVIDCHAVYRTCHALDIIKDCVSDYCLYKQKAENCSFVNETPSCDGEVGADISKRVLACYRENDVGIVLSPNNCGCSTN